MAFTSITAGQTDADSPVDQTLMDLIRTNLDDLDGRTITNGDSHDHNGGDGAQIPQGGLSNIFGSWTSKTVGTIYQATTDGFVIAYRTATSNGLIVGYTDSSATPTTIRAQDITSGVDPWYASITFPVKKDDYYKTTKDSGGSATMFWVPLGS